MTAFLSVVIALCGGTVDPVADAAPGEVGVGGVHMVASVDAGTAVPAAELGLGVPFAHAVKVSGDFSVALDGAASVRSGQIVVGYLIGCAVDLSNGVSIGIAPSIGFNASISPSVQLQSGVDLNLAINAPPSITIGGAVAVGVQPSVGVDTGLQGELAVTLAPGTVTAAVVGAAELDSEATFPYTFTHANTPLNVNSCPAPASAMPFVTARTDFRNGTIQTTGYGNPFGF